jgi:vacuolar-type H+-ATPase subunit I/STV1
MPSAGERLDELVDELRHREDAPRTLVERLAADVESFRELLDLSVELRDAAVRFAEDSEHTCTLIARHAETTDLVAFEQSVRDTIEEL